MHRKTRTRDYGPEGDDDRCRGKPGTQHPPDAGRHPSQHDRSLAGLAQGSDEGATQSEHESTRECLQWLWPDLTPARRVGQQRRDDAVRQRDRKGGSQAVEEVLAA